MMSPPPTATLPTAGAGSVLVLAPGADLPALLRALNGAGAWAEVLRAADGVPRAVRLTSPTPPLLRARLESLPGVVDVLATVSPHPRVDTRRGRTVTVGLARPAPVSIGAGAPPILIAGPCSAESAELTLAAAAMAAHAGARILRGGAYKPRTSPYSYAGGGAAALRWLRDAADAHGLALVTEALSEADVAPVAEVADLVQVGSRNMQNFALLRAVGASGRPALLKRGMAASVEEWLLAAEHLLDAGAGGVVLCERGVRGPDAMTRNVLDVGAIAVLAGGFALPVVADPSHAAGRRDLVRPLAAAALAAGAHGVMVEAHPRPEDAQSDAAQALDAAALASVGALFAPRAGAEGADR